MASSQARGGARAGARMLPIGNWGAAGGSEPCAEAMAAGHDGADGSAPFETSSGQGPGLSTAGQQQRRQAGDPPGSPKLDPHELVPATQAHAQPARKRLRKRGPSPPGPGTAAAADAVGFVSLPSLDHGKQAGSSSPVGGLPLDRPAEPSLEGARTASKPKPQEDQQQPAPARRRRLTKRRSSAAEGVTAADEAAKEQAAVRQQQQVSGATPEPWVAGNDADMRTAGREAAGCDTDMRAASSEGADSVKDMRAAGPEDASGSADNRTSPDSAEAVKGAATGTGGSRQHQSTAKRGSAILRPAAADAEDKAQAGVGEPGPQQPAKRKRLTKPADPADVAAVGAGRAVGGAGQPEQAGAGVAGQLGGTAGAETGAAAEEGGVAMERTSLVS